MGFTSWSFGKNVRRLGTADPLRRTVGDRYNNAASESFGVRLHELLNIGKWATTLELAGSECNSVEPQHFLFTAAMLTDLLTSAVSGVVETFGPRSSSNSSPGWHSS